MIGFWDLARLVYFGYAYIQGWLKFLDSQGSSFCKIRAAEALVWKPWKQPLKTFGRLLLEPFRILEFALLTISCFYQHFTLDPSKKIYSAFNSKLSPLLSKHLEIPFLKPPPHGNRFQLWVWAAKGRASSRFGATLSVASPSPTWWRTSKADTCFRSCFCKMGWRRCWLLSSSVGNRALWVNFPPFQKKIDCQLV